ncbi:MAG: hypothetical protein ACT4OS_00910 [Acidimicrobiales bacterium]
MMLGVESLAGLLGSQMGAQIFSAQIFSALTWEPNIKGGLYVLISVVVLCGSPQLILSTNVGSRLGFQLAGAGLFGFFVIIGLVWWVYGIGPKGPDPSWMPQTTVTGNPAAATDPDVLGTFPAQWKSLELTDVDVADALPFVDGQLVAETGSGEEGLFESTSEYLATGAFQLGGQAYGPLGLDFRPFNVFHTPKYLLVQVQPVVEQEADPSGAPPTPKVDPDAEEVSVVLLRDLGAKRLHPGVFTMASLAIFGLLVYQLHVRDKELMAAKAAAKG